MAQQQKELELMILELQDRDRWETTPSSISLFQPDGLLFLFLQEINDMGVTFLSPSLPPSLRSELNSLVDIQQRQAAIWAEDRHKVCPYHCSSQYVLCGSTFFGDWQTFC